MTQAKARSHHFEVALNPKAKSIPQSLLKCASFGNQGDYVILVPGLLTHRWGMGKLKKILGEADYRTACFDYSYRNQTLNVIANKLLTKFISTHCVNVQKRINFVTHGTGSLVLEIYLKNNHDLRFHRAVALAPTNAGSHVTSWLERYFGWVLKPLGRSLDPLIDHTRRALANKLDSREAQPTTRFPQVEVGVIAGNRSFSPLGHCLIKGQHDGFISVEATKLPGIQHHIVLPTSHYLMLSDDQAADKTLRFIQTGKF